MTTTLKEKLAQKRTAHARQLTIGLNADDRLYSMQDRNGVLWYKVLWAGVHLAIVGRLYPLKKGQPDNDHLSGGVYRVEKDPLELRSIYAPTPDVEDAVAAGYTEPLPHQIWTLIPISAEVVIRKDRWCVQDVNSVVPPKLMQALIAETKALDALWPLIMQQVLENPNSAEKCLSEDLKINADRITEAQRRLLHYAENGLEVHGAAADYREACLAKRDLLESIEAMKEIRADVARLVAFKERQDANATQVDGIPPCPTQE